jgi:hypothetical protein
MIGEYWTGRHFSSPAIPLLIILSLLGISIAASLLAERRENKSSA